MSGIAQSLFMKAAAASGGITFVAAGVVGSGSSFALAQPAGFQAGDLLVIVGAAGNNFNTTDPSSQGYTAATTAGSSNLHLWYKIATGGEGSINMASGGGGSVSQAAVSLAYRGVNAAPLNVQNATTATGTSTTPTPASLTTTVANCLIITAWATATLAITANGSTNSRANTTTGYSFTVGDEIQAATGASTARAGSMSSGAWRAFAIAFKP